MVWNDNQIEKLHQSKWFNLEKYKIIYRWQLIVSQIRLIYNSIQLGNASNWEMNIFHLIGMYKNDWTRETQDSRGDDRRSSSPLIAATWPMEWRISLCHLARNEKVKIWKNSLKLLGTKSLGLISSGVTAINFSLARLGAKSSVCVKPII
jgi:hypothetical protein